MTAHYNNITTYGMGRTFVTLSGLSIYIMCFYVIHAYGRKHFLLFYSSFNHFIFCTALAYNETYSIISKV